MHCNHVVFMLHTWAYYHPNETINQRFTIFSNAALGLVHRTFQCCTWAGSPYFPMLNLVWFTVFSSAALGLVHRTFQCCTWVGSPYFPMLHLDWFTVFSNAELGLVHCIFQCCTWVGSPYFLADIGLIWVGSPYFPMLHLGWFTIFSGRHWSYLGWFTIFSGRHWPGITFNDSQQLWIIYSLPSKFLLLNMSSPGLKNMSSHVISWTEEAPEHKKVVNKSRINYELSHTLKARTRNYTLNKKPNCFKNPNNPLSIDLFLTNRPR